LSYFHQESKIVQYSFLDLSERFEVRAHVSFFVDDALLQIRMQRPDVSKLRSLTNFPFWAPAHGQAG